MTKSSIALSMLVLGLGLMLASCSMIKYSFETSEITEDNSVRNQQVNDRYAEMLEQDILPGKILFSNKSLPEGFRKNGDLISVEKGYQHRLLGTGFITHKGFGLNEQEAIIETKRMAAAAGGDFVFAPELTDLNGFKTSRFHWWIIKLDPKVKKKLLGR